MTLAASAFPSATPASPSGPGSVVRVPRSEWTLFQRVVARRPGTDLNFGDYGIENPDFEPTPNARAVSNLRYTIDSEWMFIKGKLVTKGGASYFRDVCRILYAMPEYQGSMFSWGDQIISQCGAGAGGTGNATTWRQIAITHHITFVLEQLANMTGSVPVPATPASP